MKCDNSYYVYQYGYDYDFCHPEPLCGWLATMPRPRRLQGLLSYWQESKRTSVSSSHWPSFWVRMFPGSSAMPFCSRHSRWTPVGSRLSPLSTQIGQCCLSSLCLTSLLALFPLHSRTSAGPGILTPGATEPQTGLFRLEDWSNKLGQASYPSVQHEVPF